MSIRPAFFGESIHFTLEPSWSELSIIMVGYDGLLKWGRFGEFCMYSFLTRCWNVNIVIFGKTMVECNPPDYEMEAS